MKKLLLIAAFICSVLSISQTDSGIREIISSLKNTDDPNERSLLINKADSILNELPFEDYEVLNKEVISALRPENLKELFNIGIFEYNHIIKVEHDFPKGEKRLLKLLKNLEEKENLDEQYIMYIYNHLSYHYSILSNYVLSNSYAFKCLEYYKKHNDSINISQIYNSIATNYLGYDQFDDAEKYFHLSYDIGKALDDVDLMSAAKINLGANYEEAGKLEKAKSTYFESLVLHKEWGVPTYIGYSHVLIGWVYEKLNQIDSSNIYLDSARMILEDPIDYFGMSFYHIGKARLYLKSGHIEKADQEIDIAKEYSQLSGFFDNELISLNIKHDLDFKLGRFKNAYQNLKSYYRLRDSLFNPHVSKEIAGMEYKFDYESKRFKDSLKHHEEQRISDLQHEEEVRRYWIYMVSGVSIGFLLLLLVIYAIRQSRLRKKKNEQLRTLNHTILEQKDEVEMQKLLVEEKNKEIVDSINYAKRIQSAILPPTKLVKSYLYNSFILYKPKDIVAGDFYWLEHKDDYVLFAVADCTGHGVPGAMVSVICNNGLNRSVREEGLTDVAKVLDKTKEIVIQEFEKSEDEVKDGMDIAIVRMEMKEEGEIEKNGVKIQYAGAHNPLWIIRKDSNEIEVVKANKQPIGKFQKSTAFDSHELTLFKGDTIYLFSDGYSDQFGGEKGKKMKSKAFKDKLLSIQNLNMDQQKKELDDSFENWRGEIEQIDDVCVIGVRV